MTERRPREPDAPMNPHPPQDDRTRRAYMVWRYFAASLLVMAAIFLLLPRGARPDTEIAYSRFKQALRADEVAQVTMHGDHVSGRFKKAQKLPVANGATSAAVKSFETTLPPIADPQLLPLLQAHQVTVRAQSTEVPWWQRLLVDILPWILILGFIFYGGRLLSRRMMGAGGRGGLFDFARSPAKRFRRGATHVTFDDVAGLEGAKNDLREIVDYLRDPRRFRAIGAKVPKGILLMGAPGIGKTLLARAVAGEADVPSFTISGSEFVEMFVGVGAARVRDMFKAAKQESPAIIFIDEIDSVGRVRGAGLGGGHDEREQTLNQILGEMDGFAPHEDVVVLAATNRPDVLDPALLRPGRFDRKVVLDLPGKKARRRILELHTRAVPCAGDVDLGRVAAQTAGFAGADLENLVNEAALLAGRDRKTAVDMDSFEHARDKIILGAERETILSEDEKRVSAVHETGHALIAWLSPGADPLAKVTIIPRGHALGATEQLPEEERHHLTHGYLAARLGIMLAGRAAEKVTFDEVSSGAESDLKQATQLARRMVCHWGMSERIGPVAFNHGEEHVFLGREIAQPRDFSERTAGAIDDEIRRLITEAELIDEQLLRQHRRRHDALARALLEAETLAREDVERVLAAEEHEAGSPAREAQA